MRVTSSWKFCDIMWVLVPFSLALGEVPISLTGSIAMRKTCLWCPQGPEFKSKVSHVTGEFNQV